MKYFVIFLVLLAGGISGYTFGAYRSKAAIEALATVEQAAKQDKAEADKAISALKENLAGLTSAHKSELSKIEAEYRQQRANLDTALASKDKKIKDLTTRMSTNRQEIERLKNMAGNVPDPVEKKKLLARVALLESEKKSMETGMDGLKCLGVAAPDEILLQLQGKQP
jgi:flagellar basal body-associated protein FliL